MTTIATAWLALSLTLAAMAWLAIWSRRATVGRTLSVAMLPAFAVVAALALYTPLGRPIPLAPPAGEYTVLGARIDVDVAIYALLDDGKGEPVYYRLPYSEAQAKALQEAMNGEGGASAKIDGDGGASFEGEPPVTEDANKRAETPMYEVR